MAHLTIAYSATLDQRVKMFAVVHAVHEAVLATGFFDLKDVCTRAIAHEHYQIANSQAQYAFAHLTLQMASGHTAQEREAAGEAAFKALCEQLAPVQSFKPVSISCEVQEMDAKLYFQKNNLERWLKADKKKAAE